MVLGLLAIINFVVWNMAKPFGWLSPLMVVKTYRLSANGAEHILRRVRFKKGRVRSLGDLESAIAADDHVFADEEGMRLLSAERLPLGFDMMSKGKNGAMVIHGGASAKQNEFARMDFMKIDNWTDFIVSPEDFAPAKPVAKEIPETSEMAL